MIDTMLELLCFAFVAWWWVVCCCIPPALVIGIIWVIGHFAGRW